MVVSGYYYSAALYDKQLTTVILITVGQGKNLIAINLPVDFVDSGTHVKLYNAGVGSADLSTGCSGDYYPVSFEINT